MKRNKTKWRVSVCGQWLRDCDSQSHIFYLQLLICYTLIYLVVININFAGFKFEIILMERAGEKKVTQHSNAIKTFITAQLYFLPQKWLHTSINIDPSNCFFVSFFRQQKINNSKYFFRNFILNGRLDACDHWTVNTKHKLFKQKYKISFEKFKINRNLDLKNV